jgi:hypothetical protein
MVGQTNFGGCCINGILGTPTLVDMDQHDTTWFVTMNIWLNTTTKGLTMNAILDLGYMSQVVCHDDWPPLTIVNKVGQTKVVLPMIMNFLSSHFFMVMVLTWFGIQYSIVGWNPMLMNGKVLCNSVFIPTLTKFLAYQGSSNTPNPWSSHGLEFSHLGY